MDCLASELVFNSWFSDIVFVILLRTAVETSTQVASHWRGPHLLDIVVLTVADGLFGLCAPARACVCLRVRA